jgi:hypothetical protein
MSIDVADSQNDLLEPHQHFSGSFLCQLPRYHASEENP